jgi:anti-anti-sigma factor
MSNTLVPAVLTIRQTKDGTRLIVALWGDLSAAPILEGELSASLSGDEYRRAIVDLAQLDFMDSRGLNALTRAQQTADSRPRAFSLRRAGRQIQRLFDRTGYGARFTSED